MLAWLTTEEACDLLRTSGDNATIVEALAAGLPAYVETTTGYPAKSVGLKSCHELVRALCRFLLQLWYDPDGTDAAQLTKVVDGLTYAVKAMVVAEGL